MKKEKFACLCLRFGIETQGYKYSETTRNIAKGWNKNIIVLFDARNKPIKTKRREEHKFVAEFCFL